MDKYLAKFKKHNGLLDTKRLEGVLNFVNDECDYKATDQTYYKKAVDAVAPLRPDEDTIEALFLHRAHVEETISEDKILAVFGADILDILRSVKKLEALNYIENDKKSKVEVLRMMFLSMARDMRAIFIVLTCRLVKMQMINQFVEASARGEYAKETMDLYVPIASRLGIYSMKGQLEDFAFRYSQPDEYAEISEQLTTLAKSCNISISYIKRRLENFLKERGVEAEVNGRIKNIYSIYRKLNRKGLSSISDLYDVFAMRVILPAKKDDEGEESLDQLYAVLGMLHSEWKPISRRFKDFMAVPKPNGYRSLHTVLLGLGPDDNDQPVEVQIRDSEMHNDAEYGIASHWAYKEGGPSDSRFLKNQIEWIKGLEKVKGDFGFDQDFASDMVELDVLEARIFVLTPRGEVKDLPGGSCPIDFAYCIHTDVGHKCVMAKVNGSIVSLDYKLKNGDVVEIITRKDAAPKLQWLSIVKTSFSKHKIKAYFSSLNRDKNIKEGRTLVNNQLERIGKPLLDQNYSVLKSYLGKNLSLVQREALIEEVGRGAKLASDVVRKVFPYEKSLVDRVVSSGGRGRVKKGADGKKTYLLEEQILVGGEKGLPIKIASCCKPSRKHSVVGYVTRGSRITIHRYDCSLLETLDPNRIIPANWFDGEQVEKYLVGIKVTAYDRVGLMKDLTVVISDLGIQIRDIAIRKPKESITEEFFDVELERLEQFDQLVDRLESVKGVMKVSRSDKK